MDSRDLLPMGEISRRSGFAASAIRYYEAEGLIAAHRSGGGHRQFERNMLRRLAFIRAASNVGLSIEEIRGELARHGEHVAKSGDLEGARGGFEALSAPGNPAPVAMQSVGSRARSSTGQSSRWMCSQCFVERISGTGSGRRA